MVSNWQFRHLEREVAAVKANLWSKVNELEKQIVGKFSKPSPGNSATTAGRTSRAVSRSGLRRTRLPA